MDADKAADIEVLSILEMRGCARVGDTKFEVRSRASTCINANCESPCDYASPAREQLVPFQSAWGRTCSCKRHAIAPTVSRAAVLASAQKLEPVEHSSMHDQRRDVSSFLCRCASLSVCCESRPSHQARQRGGCKRLSGYTRSRSRSTHQALRLQHGLQRP